VGEGNERDEIGRKGSVGEMVGWEKREGRREGKGGKEREGKNYTTSISKPL